MGTTTGPSYAVQADLFRFGVPAAALAGVTSADLDAQLEASSRFIDCALERFQPPLASWGTDIVEAVCLHAAMALRSAKGLQHPKYDDAPFRDRYEDMIVGRPGQLSWLQRVARGEFTPTSLIDSTPEVAEMGAVGWSDGGGDRGWILPGGAL